MIPGHMESYFLYLSCKGTRRTRGRGHEMGQREGTWEGPEGGEGKRRVTYCN